APGGVIKIVVVGEAREGDGASKLHAHFHAAVFQRGRDNRVIGHVEFGPTLLKLIADPLSLVALGNGHVNFVLHHIFKIICIHRDRDVEIAGVNDDREDRHGDNKLQSRSAALILPREKEFLVHSLPCLEKSHCKPAPSDARNTRESISRPSTISGLPIRSSKIHLTAPPMDFLSRSIALTMSSVERSPARGSGPQSLTASRNDSNSPEVSMPRLFDISPATSIPRPTASP